MILVMDVGNTNMVIGLYDNKQLTSYWRLATDQRKTEDEYGLQMIELLNSVQSQQEQIDGIIISSVVPPLLPVLEKMSIKYFNVTPLLVGPGVKTGLNIRCENPREVGADRIVNAVAAIQEYDGPIVVVSIGTAATFCYIDENHQYIGGAIAPGPGVSTKALYEEASKLPRVEISKPGRVIGTNTVHALQSGLFYGFTEQIDGMLRRIAAETNSQPTVVATGGFAELFGETAQMIDTVDPLLTLKGLYYIYNKNTF